MPKINQPPEIYGSNKLDQRLTFRERLMKRFKDHEWVRVINIDNEPFFWQYLPSHSEKIEFTPDPMKITYRDPVESYVLGAGESEVIVGANAYIMIEALYKKIISKKVIDSTPHQDPKLARNFNWTDGQAQEKLIDRIYLGKEQVTFKNPKTYESTPTQPKVTKAVNDKPTTRMRRSA